MRHYSTILLMAVTFLLSKASIGQTVSEKVLGKVPKPVQSGPGMVVSPSGDNLARRERIGTQERYLTLSGAGPLYDRLYGGASWVNGNLVYLARLGQSDYLIDGAKRIKLIGKPTTPLAAPGLWLSADRTHYSVFASDGKTVRWYRDGVLQSERFDRLQALVPLGAISELPFVGTKQCKTGTVAAAVPTSLVWDIIYQAVLSSDGRTLLERGLQASLPIVQRNGRTILSEPASEVQISSDGTKWFAVVDRSADGVNQQVLLENGNLRVSAQVSTLDQRFYMSANGKAWVWKISDQDGVGATLHWSTQSVQHYDTDPTVIFSSDGTRNALLRQANVDSSEVSIVLDNKEIGKFSGLQPQTFRFGPNKAFGIEAHYPDGSASVISNLGVGGKYQAVSALVFFNDGTPAYAARTLNNAKVLVLGKKEIPVNVDDLYFIQTLKMEQGILKVTGSRGDELVSFSASL